MSILSKYYHVVKRTEPILLTGKVTKIEGLKIESLGPYARIGEICRLFLDQKEEYTNSVLGEIVGFYDSKHMYIMPYYPIHGISPGCSVQGSQRTFHVSVGNGLLGRIIDGLGNPIDGKKQSSCVSLQSIFNSPPDPLTRPRIENIMSTGIRTIDSLMSVGEGQRIGIFAGSGVGKSTLLGMIARNIESDVNVIALIGERGREVREFIEKDLGEEGFKKSVLVVATSDTTPLMRVRAAYTATAMAEYFRDQGKKVVLMMDSITRFCRAQREIGLSIGEPPTSGGYPPSVYTVLPELLERSGTSDKGSITGFYSVLVEGDDFSEPVTDAVRGILDGHIYLDRKLASRAHYPAIDIKQSISRSFLDIVSPEHAQKAAKFKEAYTAYKEQEDLINIGAYQKGVDPLIDQFIANKNQIYDFLKQRIDEQVNLDTIMSEFQKIPI